MFGPDCIPGTPDDDDNNVGDDDCPDGHSYDFDICMCINDNPECIAPTCATDEVEDPVEGCTCIT